MKRILLSLLSTAAVFGAIAPMAHAMPTRLENVRQAHLNDTYLNPRQADLPYQDNTGTGTTLAQGQPSDLGQLDQIRRAHRNDVYLNPRQISQATANDHNTLAQVQQTQNPGSRIHQIHLKNLDKH